MTIVGGFIIVKRFFEWILPRQGKIIDSFFGIK